MQQPECVCLSPYECTPYGFHILKNTLSTHFLCSHEKLLIIQSFNELKKFTKYPQMNDDKVLNFAFKRVSKKYDANVKIVIVGPLRESDMNDANQILIPIFGEIFYLPLSDNEIFYRNEKLEIPGFPLFNIFPKSILEGLATHEIFIFNEDTFKVRQTSFQSQYFEGSDVPSIEIDGIYHPFHFSKKRKAMTSLSPSQNGNSPKKLKIDMEKITSIEKENAEPLKEVNEIRVRFSGVPGECFICIDSYFKFMKTVENKIYFPIGTKLKFEYPEEKTISGRSVYFGPKGNEIGMYDMKNHIFYIYP